MHPQGFDNTDARITGARTSAGCTLQNGEVSRLRQRIAGLTHLSEAHMQPLKVSRYQTGQRFDIHTDAWRGDLRGRRPPPSDFWADRARAKRGVPGAAIPGVNRIVTVFVYLNTVLRGGRTRWRWLDHDARDGGGEGAAFYDRPRPGSGRTDIARGSGPELSVAPEEGLAVIHFPSALPEFGGVTDYNAWHEVWRCPRVFPRPPPTCLQRPARPAAGLAGRGCRRRQVDRATVHLEPSGSRLAARTGSRELGAKAEAL